MHHCIARPIDVDVATLTQDQPQVTQITIAAEQPALKSFAQDYCAAIFPDLAIGAMPLETFTEALFHQRDPEELQVLAVHADAAGHLPQGSPLLEQLLTSRVPVLVLRQPEGQSSTPVPSGRVVIPLDGSAVAGQAIPVASRIARWNNLPVKFIMVMTTHGLEWNNLRYRDSVARRVLVSTPQLILIMQAHPLAEVVIDGYQACGRPEPLKAEPVRFA